MPSNHAHIHVCDVPLMTHKKGLNRVISAIEGDVNNRISTQETRPQTDTVTAITAVELYRPPFAERYTEGVKEAEANNNEQPVSTTGQQQELPISGYTGLASRQLAGLPQI